ncbi:MAG: murein biosynthesis integral membrane protein MurJ [Candidatus Omnitrophota bacterium]
MINMSTNKSSPRHPHHHIAKSASLISIATVVSRVLGFIRDILIAQFFGTAQSAQAFVVAFRIPNLFRDLVGEGAANAAVVPVFSEYLAKERKEEFWKLFNVVMNLFLIVTAVITLLGIFFAPLIVKIMAPGFIRSPEKLLLTIKLTRIMFPYLVLIAVTAYGMGVLFTFRSFFAPAFAPCLLNLAMITAAMLASGRMPEPVVGLAVGVVAGGILQLLFQVPPLFRRGMQIMPVKDFRHPAARKIGRLLLPRVFGSAVYQLNLMVDTICASLGFVVGEGAVAAIYYANRVIQFPLGVFGVALASVVLPTLSGYAAQKDAGRFKDTLSFSLRGITLIMFPCAVFLLVLSQPIIRVLFQRGEFDGYSTQITAWALLFYALGLFSYSGVKILVSSFYSLQDTVTPVKIAGVCLIVNAVLNIILMWPLKVGGIALASAASATLNYFLLYAQIKKRIGVLRIGLRQYLFKVMTAAALMFLLTFILWNRFFLQLDPLTHLAITVFAGVAGFIVFCLFLRVKEMQDLWLWILNR